MYLKNFIRQNKHLLLILLAAVLLRAFFFAAVLQNFGDKGFYPSNSEDSEQYFRLARTLVLHNVFSQDSAPPFGDELVRPPGYPFFISIFFRIIPSAWFAIIFQNMVAAGIILLIYGTAMLLFQRRIIALTAALIYAVEPTVIYWNNQLLSETLFTFAILAAVYIFVKNTIVDKQYLLPAAAGVGALLAAANYTRMIAQFILLIFILAYFAILKMSFKSIFRGVAFLILTVMSFFILSAPWMIRNKILFNSYDFSANSGGLGFRRQLEIMYMNTGGDMEEFRKIDSSREKIATIKYIAKHPLIFAKINLFSAVIFLMGDGYFTTATAIYPPLEKQRVGIEWWGSGRELAGFLRGHRGAEAILFFGGKTIILFLNLFALSGIIFWLSKHKKYRAVLFLFLLLIYYFILASSRTSYSRFRQPVNPYIYIFAAAGIYRFADYFKSVKKRTGANSDSPFGNSSLSHGKL